MTLLSTTTSTRARRLLLLVALGAPAILDEGGAHAAPRPAALDPALEAKAKKLAEQGGEAFRNGQYQDCIDYLKMAYLLVRAPGLLRQIGMAFEKSNDANAALYYYHHYLDLAAPDAPQRGTVEEAIANLENAPARSKRRAHRLDAPDDTAADAPPSDEPPPVAQQDPEPPRRRRRAEPPPEPPPPPPPPAQMAPSDVPEPSAASSGAPPSRWSHEPIDSSRAGDPVDVRVQAPKMPGTAVTLYYRPAGAAEFSAVQMVRRGFEIVGRIPPEATRGRSLQYYVEAKKGDRVVEHAGSASEPNIVLIEGGSSEPPPDNGTQVAQPAPPPSDSSGGSVSMASDDEHAPLQAQRPGEGPRASAPQAARRATSSDDGGPPDNGSRLLTWVGVGLLAGGAVIAGAAGGGLLAEGIVYGQTVNTDHACVALPANVPNPPANVPPNCVAASKKLIFNDPNPPNPPNDLSIQSSGQTFSTLGFVAIGVGSAVAVAGAVLVGIDQARKGRGGGSASRAERRLASVLPRIPLVAPWASASGAGVDLTLRF